MRGSWLLLLAACASGPEVTTDDTDTTDTPTDALLLGLALSPSQPSLAAGESVRFTVRAYYDDTSFADLTEDLVWSVSEARIATIDLDGNLVAHLPGATDVYVTTADGAAARTRVTVRDDGLAISALDLVPRAPTLAVGGSVTLSAQATFEDGTGGNLAASCTWSVSPQGVATVNAGTIQAVAEGDATVTATCRGTEAEATVTVVAEAEELGFCDLVITESLVEASSGEVVWVGQVENQGSGLCPGFYVDGLLTDGSAPEWYDGVATTWIAGLGPDDSALVLVTGEDIPGGDYTAWLWADPTGWIDDADPSNNLSDGAEVSVGGSAELVLTEFDGFSFDGETYYYIEIENVGDAPAYGFWLDVFTDPSSDPEVCDYGDDSVWIDELLPGEAAYWEPLLPYGPGPLGWLSVAWVDSCDDVVEQDEDDNLADLYVDP